jgi:hypothetical protein
VKHQRTVLRLEARDQLRRFFREQDSRDHRTLP